MWACVYVCERGGEEVEEELMLINSFGHWGPVRLIKEAAVMCFAPHFLSPPPPCLWYQHCVGGGRIWWYLKSVTTSLSSQFFIAVQEARKRVVVISLAEIPHRVRAQSLNIVPGLQCATSFIQLLKNAASLSVARSLHSSRFLVSPAHICEYNWKTNFQVFNLCR